jgi:hypothetical protein
MMMMPMTNLYAKTLLLKLILDKVSSGQRGSILTADFMNFVLLNVRGIDAWRRQVAGVECM